MKIYSFTIAVFLVLGFYLIIKPSLSLLVNNGSEFFTSCKKLSLHYSITVYMLGLLLLCYVNGCCSELQKSSSLQQHSYLVLCFSCHCLVMYVHTTATPEQRNNSSYNKMALVFLYILWKYHWLQMKINTLHGEN